MLIRYLRAEFQKTKHLPIRAAHLTIPVGAAAVFLLYYAYTPWESVMKLEAYYQVLAMGFPFLIGVFSALLAEQESSAGAFQNMLSAEQRAPAFFGKLMLLVLFGAGAVLLASVLFGTGFYFLQGGRTVDGMFYVAAALVLLGGNLFSYVMHLILALAMNKGVTVGIGIVESLFSALLLTGMGEGVWSLFPAAWASRFVTLLLQKYRSCVIMGTDWKLALFVCIVVTLGSFLVFYVWACRWDGAGGNE